MLNAFEECIQKVYFFLNLFGLSPDIQDDQKSILGRLYNHKIYIMHLISLNFEAAGEIFWLIDALNTGKSFLEITFLFPCLTLCLLKTFSAISFANCVNDIIRRLNMLQSDIVPTGDERNSFVKKITNENVAELKSISTKIESLIVVGILMFSLSPLLIMLPLYHKTGEVELVLPFFVKFPFDISDIRYYTLLYIHQVWATIETIYFIYGIDYFFFTCTTFIHIQFLLLQYDMESVVDEDDQKGGILSYKLNIKKLAIRHMEIIRCVELLEKIYSKSIWFNSCSSSVMICITGFNIMVNENFVTMASFASFLTFSLIQIFLYCYYGDKIMRSSVQVSDAIYNSQWYEVNARDRRMFFIILLRAQKPCKLTAYGFFDVNLTAFTNILSTSWSYFALLQTLYQPD